VNGKVKRQIHRALLTEGATLYIGFDNVSRLSNLSTLRYNRNIVAAHLKLLRLKDLGGGRARGSGGDMLSKEYLATARTLLRAAQTMTDPRVSGQLKALAEDYERRAEKASHADAAKALARSAAR
jgi:hypothetical protein